MLNPGETVRLSQRVTTGTLGEDDIEHYDVIDAQGQTIGTVIYTQSTSLTPPFKTRYSLVQTGIAGNAIVDTRW